jgi:hypothetical protein
MPARGRKILTRRRSFIPFPLAATNKCLTRSDESCGNGEATKRQEKPYAKVDKRKRRRIPPHNASVREKWEQEYGL